MMLINKYLYSSFLSFLISFLFTKLIILFFNKTKIFQPIRLDLNVNHINKIKTPSIGGFAIILSIITNIIIFCDFDNIVTKILLFIIISYAFIGFIDDFIKLFINKSGLRPKYKILLQVFFAFFAIFALSLKVEGLELFNKLFLPFKDGKSLDFIYFHFIISICFKILIIVGSSNAYNLTDGLDSLASLTILPVLCILFFFNHQFADIFIYSQQLYLIIPILFFSILGFLWHNAFPAKIFMGDTGSLSIGAIIAFISIILHIEILLPIFAFIFVIETLSVMLQVVYFKITNGKRIFKMTPIHHHFEKNGLSENQIVIRFFIISIFLGLFSIYSYFYLINYYKQFLI